MEFGFSSDYLYHSVVNPSLYTYAPIVVVVSFTSLLISDSSLQLILATYTNVCRKCFFLGVYIDSYYYVVYRSISISP
jgi:hypothetical protein